MPAASRCTTSRPGWSDQIRRAHSFRFLRVSPLALPACFPVLLFMLHGPPFRDKFSQARPSRDSFHTLSNGVKLLLSKPLPPITPSPGPEPYSSTGRTRQCVVGHSLPCLASTIF